MPDVDDDVSFPEELVERFLAEFTSPGDLVFDPFAGFGTTLVVAEQMGRRVLGIELLLERVELIKHRLRNPGTIVQWDALNLADLPLPAIDFVMTSPPYMTRAGHPQNPLSAYQTLDGDYRRYLRELCTVFETIAASMKVGGRAVINVANICTDGIITPLAADVAAGLSSVLILEQEVLIVSDTADPTIVENKCYVFRNSG